MVLQSGGAERLILLPVEIPPPLPGVSAQKCHLPEAVPLVLPQSSTKVLLWAAARAARASGPPGDSPSCHFLCAACRLLAGSRLTAAGGQGGGAGAREAGAFHTAGPPSIRHPHPDARRDDKGQNPRLGRQGVLIGVPWPPEPMQLSEN